MKTKYIRPTAQRIVVVLEGPLAVSSLQVSDAEQYRINREDEILTQQKNTNPIWGE